MADMLAPGPWLAHAARDARPDGSRVFTITDRDGRTIAVVNGGQATADMLAGALDLLAALAAMVDRWEPDSAGADRRMWEAGRDAIAKARGEDR